MEYFDFFEIPVSFLPDEETLKRRYLQHCKQYHPDFHSLSPPEVQAEVLELSTLNNQAYQTLADFHKRMGYVLECLGLLQEEGKNEVGADFLMMMMEVNEALMDLEFDANPSDWRLLSEKVKELEDEQREAILPVLRDPGLLSSGNNSALDLVKEFYLRHKYLLRIREKLNNFAPA